MIGETCLCRPRSYGHERTCPRWVSMEPGAELIRLTQEQIRPAAPVVQGADELRAEIEAAFCDAWRTLPDDVTVLAAGARIADAVLALPEVARLLAERDQAQAKVARVRELLAEEPNVQPLWEYERGIRRGIDMAKAAISRALDGGSA